MIILNCHIGRMSNHKIMQAHVMAEALERGTRWRMAPDSGFWKVEAATFGRLWNRFVRFLPVADGSRNRCFRLPGLMIVHGWTELRNFEAMKKHGDEIRRFFRPKTDVALERSTGEIVVGIHKRRGDYRTWRGGIYCYDDEVYERVMREMEGALGGTKVRFEIFSDENPARTSEEDQHLMSQCDYLIGPPSTFTLWAAFMGKVPVLHLENSVQKVALDDFNRQWE